ncbi:MAG: radical SAM protein [Candidatus Omnitrophica bacterium]|nr:radical SAM protein [Candidatus Omnitrophota bacterium]
MDSSITQNMKSESQKKSISKPGFCCLGIIDNCMLRCKMCEKWKDDLVTQGMTEATTDQYKTFLQQLRTITDEGFELDIGGGEALMRPDLLELISYARDLGFKTTVASNGWLIDKEMARRIVESGLTSIILSFDSLNSEVHDSMRGVQGVHARVVQAIEYLRLFSKDIHIGLCTIIMEKTLDGIIELVEWSNSRRDKINSILFMAVMQPNNTVKQDKWFDQDFNTIWPQDTKKVVACIDELIRRRNEGQWIANSVEQLKAFRLYFQQPNKFVKKTACNMDRGLHISAVGDIFLCFKWDNLGNIKNGADISQVWYSKEAETVRENIRQCKDNCHFLLNCFFEGDYPFKCDV